MIGDVERDEKHFKRSSGDVRHMLHEVTRRVLSGDEISVLIPTKNRSLAVLECIRSVNNQSVQPAEIIIVDASDGDGLEALIRNNAEGVIRIEYVRSEAGLTHQKNIGVQKSSGDIVLVLDDDVILNEDFIKEILNIFNNPSFDGIGCVYGDMVLNNDKHDAGWRGAFPNSFVSALNNRIHGLFRTLFFLQKMPTTGKFRLSGWSTSPTPSKPGATVLETEGAPGGYTAYYKEVLSEFRFDENLKGYAAGEDADISYRISRKYKNIFTPKAKVIHASRTSKANNYAYSKMKIENHHYLFKKNFPQALPNRFAFNLSVFGYFLTELELAIIHRNTQGLRGFLDGLHTAHNKKHDH
jgi:glycosyltransferase involved in cell wall biosynthesis